jgi:hypothetical protein
MWLLTVFVAFFFCPTRSYSSLSVWNLHNIWEPFGRDLPVLPPLCANLHLLVSDVLCCDLFSSFVRDFFAFLMYVCCTRLRKKSFMVVDHSQNFGEGPLSLSC